MSERPTPETDAELNLYLRHGEAHQISVAWIEFARKLERERDEAREALDCLLAVIGLTPIAGNREALQEAVDQGLVVLRKLEEAK